MGTTSHEFLPGGMPELERELKKMFTELFDRNGIEPLQIRRAVLAWPVLIQNIKSRRSAK